MSAALMDDAITSCEAEAASVLIGLGGEKWFEEMSFDLFTHSNSVVGDFDQNIVARNKVAAKERRLHFLCEIDNRGLERELPAFGHCVARVHLKVGHKLRALARVALDGRGICVVA